MEQDNKQSHIARPGAQVSVCRQGMLPQKDPWIVLGILRGSTVCQINGQPCLLQQAQACLLRPGDLCHQLSSAASGESQYVTILVDSDFICRYSTIGDLTLYNDLLSSKEPLVFSLTEELMQELERETAAPQTGMVPNDESMRNDRLLVQKLFICFLEQYPYGNRNHPLWLLQFIEKLQDEASFSVPLSQLAHYTPYSYSRLTRIFRNHMGISLIDYVTDIKVEHAKHLLKHTDHTMLAISSKLDFSVSYFNKLFKRKTGLTPGQYRAKSRKG